MDELISVKEASEMLGLSRVQVFNWVKSGKLPAQMVGKSYVINKSSLDEYLINNPVEKVVRDYGDTLKRLGDG